MSTSLMCVGYSASDSTVHSAVLRTPHNLGRVAWIRGSVAVKSHETTKSWSFWIDLCDFAVVIVDQTARRAMGKPMLMGTVRVDLRRSTRRCHRECRVPKSRPG